MFFSRLGYFLVKAFQGFKVNVFTNLITVGTVCISTFILLSFLIIFSNLNLLIESWGRHFKVSIYLRDNISDSERENIKKRIESFTEVEEIRYYSKEDAMDSFKKELGSQSYIVDGLTKNPLPSYFEVTFKKGYRDFESIQKVAERIKGIKQIEDIQYGQEWIEKLSNIITFIKLAVLILGGLLLGATVFITSNTIKLNIYSRRKELEIMKLVGATDNFIRFPFILEGTMIGIAGVILSIVFLYIIFVLFLENVYPSISFLLGTFNVSFLPIEYIAATIIGGVFIGIVGSTLSVNKILRV